MQKLSLDSKINVLKRFLEKSEYFSIPDVIRILNLKEQMVYQTLSSMVRKGLISRVGKGTYSFRKKEKFKPVLTGLAQQVHSLMKQKKYKFFVSGLDVLNNYSSEHARPLPVLVFVSKKDIGEAKELLLSKHVAVFLSSEMKDYSILRNLPNITDLVVLCPTSDLRYSISGIAEQEKAFCDLLFEITRKAYPLSLTGLADLYIKMRNKTVIDETRLSKVASRRGIQRDMHFIVDYKNISPCTVQFVGELIQADGEKEIGKWRCLNIQN